MKNKPSKNSLWWRILWKSSSGWLDDFSFWYWTVEAGKKPPCMKRGPLPRWWVVDMKRDPSPRSREFKWMGRDAQDPFIASPPPHNVDNVERCTATMPPLSTLIVVCRFAGTDEQRAMIAKQPPPPPDESDFQLTKHFWGCFRPGLKIETNESRKQLQCPVDTHEAIHLCCQWCSRETLR